MGNVCENYTKFVCDNSGDTDIWDLQAITLDDRRDDTNKDVTISKYILRPSIQSGKWSRDQERKPFSEIKG